MNARPRLTTSSATPMMPRISEVSARPLLWPVAAVLTKTGRSPVGAAGGAAGCTRSGSGGAGSKRGAGCAPGARGGSQPEDVGSSAIAWIVARRAGAASELGLDPVHHRAQLLPLALDLVV